MTIILAFEIMIFGVPGKSLCARCERGEWGHWLGEVTGVPGKLPCVRCERGEWGPRQAGRQTDKHEGKQTSTKARKQLNL